MVAPRPPTETQSPVFELVDADEKRADLASRKEIKFALGDADVIKLRRLLEARCTPVSFNRRVSTVRSVYFDDVRLSACRANLDGLGVRSKLRLRWYDSLRPGGEFFCEVKWRQNRVTGKHRFRIHSSQPLGELPYKQIVSELGRVLPESLARTIELNTDPVVLVQYQREHFVSHDRLLRLTIDYDIVFYDQLGRRAIDTTFGMPMRDFVVVESKLPPGNDHRVRSLLKPFSPRMTRCSKYVYGCQMIGVAWDY